MIKKEDHIVLDIHSMLNSIDYSCIVRGNENYLQNFFLEWIEKYFKAINTYENWWLSGKNSESLYLRSPSPKKSVKLDMEWKYKHFVNDKNKLIEELNQIIP